jgi:tripartite-type tricarboxylate transporter receptor subunit TctC
MARQIGERLSREWGQPVVVENKPGANTIVAADAAAKAAPDGHTIFMTTDATFSINPHLYRKLPYDAGKDFIPVTMLVLLQQMMVAHPSVPANTLAELIDYAKKNPGKLNYASYGSGSQPHLSGEMLKHKAGIDLVHVPYKGISLAVPAVIAGEVQLTFSGIASQGARDRRQGALAAPAAAPDLRRAGLPRGRDARLVRLVPARRVAEGSGFANLQGRQDDPGRPRVPAEAAHRPRLRGHRQLAG